MTESDTNMAVHEQKRLNLKAGLCMSCDQCNVHFLACKFDAKKGLDHTFLSLGISSLPRSSMHMHIFQVIQQSRTAF